MIAGALVSAAKTEAAASVTPRIIPATGGFVFMTDFMRFGRLSYLLYAFEMLFDFFQSFTLGFRQEKSGGDEINRRESAEREEHRRVAVFADGRQKNRGDTRRNRLVDEQRDAHAVGSDARRHQLG